MVRADRAVPRAAIDVPARAPPPPVTGSAGRRLIAAPSEEGRSCAPRRAHARTDLCRPCGCRRRRGGLRGAGSGKRRRQLRAVATRWSRRPRRAVPAPVVDRPGLGTSWGETVARRSTARSSARAPPVGRARFHYNDAEGVLAHARYPAPRPAPLEIYTGDGALSVALIDNDGRALPGFTAGGRTLIMGEDGERYRIVVRNATAARFEIVASVDGLDVIDGKPADPNRRGYIVAPHDVLVIDGFRTSDAARRSNSPGPHARRAIACIVNPGHSRKAWPRISVSHWHPAGCATAGILDHAPASITRRAIRPRRPRHRRRPATSSARRSRAGARPPTARGTAPAASGAGRRPAAAAAGSRGPSRSAAAARAARR